MKKIFFILIFLMIFLCACTHYYYIPNNQNIPLLKEKNEFTGSISRGTAYEIGTFELQSAYSITNHTAVMLNYLYGKGSDEWSDNSGNGTYLEGGLGYYNPLGKYGLFEIYGGAGFSHQYHQYSDYYNGYGSYYQYRGYSKLDFTKVFVQPALGLTFKGFDIALSTRLGMLNYINIDNQISFANSSEYDAVDAIAKHKTSYLFEPAITIRGGWKYVKLQIQYALSLKLNNPALKFERDYFSLGLSIDITKRFQRDKVRILTGN